VLYWGAPPAVANVYRRLVQPYGHWVLLILFASGVLLTVLRPLEQTLSGILYRLAL
jgi:hypothetical protein